MSASSNTASPNRSNRPSSQGDAVLIVPRREVPHLGPDDTTADMLRMLARRLRERPLMGANTTETAARILDDYADALATPLEYLPVVGPCPGADLGEWATAIAEAASEPDGLPPCPDPDCDHQGDHYHHNAFDHTRTCDCKGGGHGARHGWSECYGPAEHGPTPDLARRPAEPPQIDPGQARYGQRHRVVWEADVVGVSYESGGPLTIEYENGLFVQYQRGYIEPTLYLLDDAEPKATP